MGTSVTFRTSAGVLGRLRDGEILGRDPRAAAMVITDPLVSGAHAQISRRGADVVLLALRGSLRVDDRLESRVRLELGMRIWLSPDSWIEVVVIDPGSATIYDTGAPDFLNLILKVGRGTVTIERADLDHPLVIEGKPAEILIKLIRCGQRTHWMAIAGQVWPKPPSQCDELYRMYVRGRWDSALQRLRKKLLAVGVRPNLVSRVEGVVVLGLLPGDRIVTAHVAPSEMGTIWRSVRFGA